MSLRRISYKRTKLGILGMIVLALKAIFHQTTMTTNLHGRQRAATLPTVIRVGSYGPSTSSPCMRHTVQMKHFQIS